MLTRVDEVVDRPSDNAFCAPGTNQSNGRTVYEGDTTLGMDEDTVRRKFNQTLISFLALPQRCFGYFALGNFMDEPIEEDGVATLVLNSDGIQLDPDWAAVLLLPQNFQPLCPTGGPLSDQPCSFIRRAVNVSCQIALQELRHR